MATTHKPLQIFKPGRHTAMSGASLAFSESDLAASAAAYDPTVFQAPIGGTADIPSDSGIAAWRRSSPYSRSSDAAENASSARP